MRLFVAVNLPAAERARIADGTAALRGAGLPVRWVDPDAYHLTLKFLGEVSEETLPGVSSALATVGRRHAPFTLRIAGAGAFPGPRRPAVFWLGVHDAEELAALQRSVEAELTPLGLPAEARPFHPHLTLGRTRKDARPRALESAAALMNDVACEATLRIETVDLMRSHLSSRGARYECVLAAPLAA